MKEQSCCLAKLKVLFFPFFLRPQSSLLNSFQISVPISYQEHFPLTWENWKFWLENQMVGAFPFRNLQKIWAVIWGDANFLLFFLTVRSADEDILCSGPFSYHVTFYSFMFMHNISTQVVCVNGMHTSGALFFPSPVAESCIVTRDTEKSETLGMSCVRTKILG